jgi:hypothetical protein
MPRFLPRITPSARRIPERCLDWCNPADYEIYGKRLQILKEAVPSASDMRTSWEGGDGQGLREAGQRLEMSVIGIPLDESTPSEYQRVFGEIAKERPDAIMTHDIGELTTYHQLMLTLSKKPSAGDSRSSANSASNSRRRVPITMRRFLRPRFRKEREL